MWSSGSSTLRNWEYVYMTGNTTRHKFIQPGTVDPDAGRHGAHPTSTCENPEKKRATADLQRNTTLAQVRELYYAPLIC